MHRLCREEAAAFRGLTSPGTPAASAVRRTSMPIRRSSVLDVLRGPRHGGPRARLHGRQRHRRVCCRRRGERGLRRGLRRGRRQLLSARLSAWCVRGARGDRAGAGRGAGRSLRGGLVVQRAHRRAVRHLQRALRDHRSSRALRRRRGRRRAHRDQGSDVESPAATEVRTTGTWLAVDLGARWGW